MIGMMIELTIGLMIGMMIELDWIGLDWIGLMIDDWIGLDWIGLESIERLTNSIGIICFVACSRSHTLTHTHTLSTHTLSTHTYTH